MALVQRHVPPTTDEEYDAALLAGAGVPALARRHRLAGRDPRGLRGHRTTPASTYLPRPVHGDR